MVTSQPLLAELAEVLARTTFRRRGVTAADAADLVAVLRGTADLISITGKLALCRDPEDDMVLETALEGAADVIVSRDEDLTRAPAVANHLAIVGIPVLTVRRFLEELAADSL